MVSLYHKIWFDMGVQNISSGIQGICLVVMTGLLVCAFSASATTQQTNEHPALAPEQRPPFPSSSEILLGSFPERIVRGRSAEYLLRISR